jgi:hypothetical protein
MVRSAAVAAALRGADNLVGPKQNRLRDRHAERLCGPKVDDQLGETNATACPRRACLRFAFQSSSQRPNRAP